MVFLKPRYAEQNGFNNDNGSQWRWNGGGGGGGGGGALAPLIVKFRGLSPPNPDHVPPPLMAAT